MDKTPKDYLFVPMSSAYPEGPPSSIIEGKFSSWVCHHHAGLFYSECAHTLHTEMDGGHTRQPRCVLQLFSAPEMRCMCPNDTSWLAATLNFDTQMTQQQAC